MVVGFGVGVGPGFGVGVGLGVAAGVGVGDGTGLGDGDGTGVGVGSTLGAGAPMQFPTPDVSVWSAGGPPVSDAPSDVVIWLGAVAPSGVAPLAPLAAGRAVPVGPAEASATPDGATAKAALGSVPWGGKSLATSALIPGMSGTWIEPRLGSNTPSTSG